MTLEEIVEAALYEIEQLGWKHARASRIPLYRRISVRQQQLFSMAAEWNEEYAGWSAVGAVADGECDFSSLLTDDHPEVYGAERITEILVSDPGTSDLDAGTRVNIVSPRDSEYAALPPRATFRSGWLQQVGTDLDGVEQLRAYYVRKPRRLDDPTDEVELQSPHTDLLVFDLAKHIAGSAVGTDGVPTADMLAILAPKEASALLSFEAHVRGFAPVQARFG